MEKAIRKTPLHDWHVVRGANMADFGGYEMPLWYPTGVKQEHLSVLTSVGIFDTSHMAVMAVTGVDAFKLLQSCFSKDLSACVGKDKARLTPGRCVYGVYLNERGETMDDAIVYRLAEDDFVVVVNAGMGPVIAKHLLSHVGDWGAQVDDLTDKVGKMDLQGPMAAKVLGRLLRDPASAFAKLAYFSFKGHFDEASPLSHSVCLSDGTPILLSRTGYTGEFGFEILMDPSHLVTLWEGILHAGKEFGIMPCGLAARDSLRTGALLPLSHQDIGNWPFVNNPWLFSLPYNADQTGFTKTFIGSEALLNVKDPEYTLPFVGNDLRKVSTGDPATVLDLEGTEIGTVLTCATDMGIGRHGERIYSIASPDKPVGFEPKGLSCGYVKVRRKLAPGDTVDLKDQRRKIRVTIVDDIRPHRTARRPITEMI